MNNSKAAQRIQKLLALAASAKEIGSADEAAAVFARAQALATKHQIELASLAVESGVEEAITGRQIRVGKSAASWKKILIAYTTQAAGAYVYSSRAVGGDNDGFMVFELAGQPESIRHAAYMYHMIAREIERLSRDQGRGKGAKFKNAFRVAAAVTVGKRIAKQAEQTVAAALASGSASSEALALVTDASKAAKLWAQAQLGPDSKLRGGRTIYTSSREGRDAGRKAGRGINIGGNTAVGGGQRALGPAK